MSQSLENTARQVKSWNKGVDVDNHRRGVSLFFRFVKLNVLLFILVNIPFSLCSGHDSQDFEAFG